jgi:hypothetical protein
MIRIRLSSWCKIRLSALPESESEAVGDETVTRRAQSGTARGPDEPSERAGSSGLTSCLYCHQLATAHNELPSAPGSD